MKELDSTKDLNWDLESKLTNLSMECRQLKELKKKTEKSWNDEKESLKLLKTDLEILTLTKMAWKMILALKNFITIKRLVN